MIKGEQNIKKTSQQWNEEDKYTIIDPDGWDRLNYEYSFFEEQITKEEYTKRLHKSTCMFRSRYTPKS